MSYTVEKRYVISVDGDDKPTYKKEVVENLTSVSIGMIDLHVEKGLDRVRIKKLDDFGQTIKEKIYFVGKVFSRDCIYKGSDIYDVLYKYYKRDISSTDIIGRGDFVVLSSKNTFNIVTKSEITNEGVVLIDEKDIGPNLKYQKGGFECI